MDYATTRADARKYYQNIGAVFSPALQEQVYFSNHGFRHILFKRGRKGRERDIQIKRFSLLSLAVKLLGLSTTYQEFEILTKIYNGKTKEVHYWGIIAILGDEKIKVVIRKIGQRGRVHFWSVIPNYWTSRIHDKKFFAGR